MNVSDYDGIILCGGLGTRLRSVTGDTPKVMAEVNGAPFLDLIIGHLKDQGIERVILCTGHKADLVEDYYREHDFGITIDFSREDKLLGTGGAVKNVQEIISSDTFFVFNGDSFLPADLQALLNFHKEKDAVASILVSQVSEAKDFGSLEIDASGRITGFCEKIEGNARPLVNAGVYCFGREVFSLMPEDENFSLETNLFPSLVGKQFCGYLTGQKFMDIGTPQRYESVKANLKKE